MSYVKQVLIGVDQLVNACLAGWADETLSARAWRTQHRHKRWHVARITIDWIFFWQTGHCYLSFMAEIERSRSPVDERNPAVAKSRAGRIDTTGK